MTFKIISTGWNIDPAFIETTLNSIKAQTVTDYYVSVAYEATGRRDPAVQKLGDLTSLGLNGSGIIRYPENGYLYDVRNRYEATVAADIQDEDIIVTLDLDGDAFTTANVLAHLVEVYKDPNILLTYGSYRSVPFSSTCSQAEAYPDEVVANRSYRAYGLHLFNHLRTMKGKVFNSIPVDQFHFSENHAKAGQWYTKANDLSFTFCGLERVGPRFAVLPDILMDYNSENPNSAWRIASGEIDECALDFLSRPPLDQLF